MTEDGDTQLKGYTLERPPTPPTVSAEPSTSDALDSEQEADIQQAVRSAMSREATLHPDGRIPSNAPLGVDYDSDDAPGVVDFWRPPPKPPVKANAKRALEKKQARAQAKQQRRRSKVPGMTMPSTADLVHPGTSMEETRQDVDASGFASCGISDTLAAHLTANGFATPSAIQAQAIPAVLV